MPEAFKAIYPPLGTWGCWYLPGSSDFHVAWTGALPSYHPSCQAPLTYMCMHMCMWRGQAWPSSS